MQKEKLFEFYFDLKNKTISEGNYQVFDTKIFHRYIEIIKKLEGLDFFDLFKEKYFVRNIKNSNITNHKLVCYNNEIPMLSICLIEYFRFYLYNLEKSKLVKLSENHKVFKINENDKVFEIKEKERLRMLSINDFYNNSKALCQMLNFSHVLFRQDDKNQIDTDKLDSLIKGFDIYEYSNINLLE
jgi:hypothetical protein